ncbi:MAG: hypothetical protein NZ920_00910 [Aigarchaeota archaeon]|nr:hypothetical protein [Aigarchaeota archaeon]MDW8093002.1 glycosyltransferase family protein [Nitrososphaerota archaeon]
MPLIHIGVCGIGLGHADRCKKIASSLLKRGHDTSISTYGEVAVLFERLGYKVNRNFEVGYGLSDQGAVSIKSTVLRNLTFPIRFMMQVSYEARWLDELRPSVVLSDTRASTVIASRLMDIPCIVLLNQYRVLVRSDRWHRLSGLTEGVLSGVIERVWGLADEIAIADYPPPYTISEMNLTLRDDDAKKAVYLGCLLNHDLERYKDSSRYKAEFGFDPDELVILIHATGPRPERTKFNAIMESIVPELEEFQILYTRGTFGGETNVRRGSHLIIDWIEDEYSALAAADIVVTRGGQTTLAKALSLGKRIISIPISGHTEQRANAESLASKNAAIALEEEEVSPTSLRTAIGAALNSIDSRTLKAYVDIAASLRGTERLIDLILSYC